MAKKNKNELKEIEQNVVSEEINSNEIIIETPIIEEENEEMVVDNKQVIIGLGNTQDIKSDSPLIYGEFNEEPKIEIKIDDDVLAETLNVDTPTEIPVELVKPKRTIDSLSKDEYRTYLRTGKIPE